MNDPMNEKYNMYKLIFDIAAPLTRQVLNPKKYQLVVMGPDTAAAIAFVKKWLTDHLHFTHVLIESMHVYVNIIIHVFCD